LKRSFRLTRSEDINRVRQQGQSFVHAAIVLGRLPNQLGQNRIAIIAGRSVGGAVQRNLAKRRLRSAYQSLQAGLQNGFDLVIIARRPILEIEYTELIQLFATLFRQAGFMKE